VHSADHRPATLYPTAFHQALRGRWSEEALNATGTCLDAHVITSSSSHELMRCARALSQLKWRDDRDHRRQEGLRIRQPLRIPSGEAQRPTVARAGHSPLFQEKSHTTKKVVSQRYQPFTTTLTTTRVNPLQV